MEDKASLYFDYNATTPLDEAVVGSIVDALTNFWANPSSSYPVGRHAKVAVDGARSQVASAVGCKHPDREITFTSGGTEANALVIHSAVEAFKKWNLENGVNKQAKPHVITSNVEHPAIDLPLRQAAADDKIDLSFVNVNPATGSVVVNDVVSCLQANTCLVSIMLANNETGIIQPVSDIGRALMHENQERRQSNLFNILFHTDAAQALAKIPVDVDDLNVDYLTIVGHKFYGPRIGALFHRQDVPVVAMFLGGGQEAGLRAGTENTPMIVGLGTAARVTVPRLAADMAHLRAMRERLKEGLKNSIGDGFVENFGNVAEEKRLPSTLSASFRGVVGHDLLNATSRAKMISASTQAACHSNGNTEGSPILIRSGVRTDLARGTIRLSVGRGTTPKVVDRAVQILAEAYSRLTSSGSECFQENS